MVRSPEFVLTGTVYDSTPVELSFTDSERVVGEARTRSREFLGVWITDFTFQYRIPAGVSTIEMVAVDSGGKTATEGYSVD